MVTTKNGLIRTRAQVNQKLNSGMPGYHSKLPTVFPYFWKGSQQEVWDLVDTLMEVQDEPGEGNGYWFAVTGHPKAMQSEVTLWLSADAAQFLLGSGTISSVNEYERGY